MDLSTYSFVHTIQEITLHISNPRPTSKNTMWFKILALALLSAACDARDVVPGKGDLSFLDRLHCGISVAFMRTADLLASLGI